MTEAGKVLIKHVCIYPFMASLMQEWQQLSDRGCMGDEVCIWRNAEILNKRCHFPRSISNLPIPSDDGITAYKQLLWGVFCDQYWECVSIHDFCFTDLPYGLPICSMRRLAGRLFTTSCQFFIGPVVGVQVHRPLRICVVVHNTACGLLSAPRC